MKIRLVLSLLVSLLFFYENKSEKLLKMMIGTTKNQTFSATNVKEKRIAEKQIAQQYKANFDVVVSNVKGDLNNDGIA